MKTEKIRVIDIMHLPKPLITFLKSTICIYQLPDNATSKRWCINFKDGASVVFSAMKLNTPAAFRNACFGQRGEPGFNHGIPLVYWDMLVKVLFDSVDAHKEGRRVIFYYGQKGRLI